MISDNIRKIHENYWKNADRWYKTLKNANNNALKKYVEFLKKFSI